MDGLVERSTSSVVDLGSNARGDAGLESDLDILVGP
jgi:predicted nucleotidyltransferase